MSLQKETRRKDRREQALLIPSPNEQLENQNRSFPPRVRLFVSSAAKGTVCTCLQTCLPSQESPTATLRSLQISIPASSAVRHQNSNLQMKFSNEGVPKTPNHVEITTQSPFSPRLLQRNSDCGDDCSDASGNHSLRGRGSSFGCFQPL